VFWIEEQRVPFAVLGDQWIAFDDDNSLTIKVVLVDVCLCFHLAFFTAVTFRVFFRGLIISQDRSQRT